MTMQAFQKIAKACNITIGYLQTGLSLKTIQIDRRATAKKW